MTPAARRLVTVPACLGLAAGAVATAPVWAPLLLLADLVRRRRFASLRCGFFFAFLLACESAGILASFGLWLLHGPWRGGSSARYVDDNFRLQCWWASALLHGSSRIFALRVSVAGESAIPGTPLLLFLRHASLADTLLPAVFVSAPHGIRLRYVLKRELLWDPCLDIVGNRLPNHFVDRDADDSEAEIAAVGALADGLAHGEGALIYPEGTRFSTAKRARVIERLRERGLDTAARRAEKLRYVLPPRPAGPLALIAHAPQADVLLCAHRGFEGAANIGHLWSGRLIGATIAVRFWRVSAHEVPKEVDARREWLFAQWEAIDAWLDAGADPCPGA